MNTMQSIAIASKCIAETTEYQNSGSIKAYMEFFEKKTEYVSLMEV